MAQETITAPLAGKVLKVCVKAGDKVNEDDEVCTLESMKMENTLYAPVSGTVTEVKVAAGQFVQAGDTIAVIEY